MLLSIGKTHGHFCDKFETVRGLQAVELGSNVAAHVCNEMKPREQPSVRNPFAALRDEEESDSAPQEDGEGSEAQGETNASLDFEEAGAKGAAAHIECR